jgi:hypothetical protein
MRALVRLGHADPQNLDRSGHCGIGGPELEKDYLVFTAVNYL